MTEQRWIGVDIGGTAIKLGALTAEGQVIEELSLDPGYVKGTAHVLDAIVRSARQLGARHALGVGVPGLMRRTDGHVLHSPNIPGFRDLALRAELAARLGLAPERVSVENDANAAALGEQWLGSARGADDMLLLTLGTGIGGGLILHGELYAGAGMAGEVGHVVIDPDGPRCGCGSRGCLETLASATAAKRRALELGLPREKPGDLKLLAEHARAGSAPEKQLLFDIGRDLGRGLGPVVCLLDLNVFVFGGGFSAALDTMDAGIRAGVDERSYGERSDRLSLRRAQLGPSAGWIGAARPSLKWTHA